MNIESYKRMLDLFLAYLKTNEKVPTYKDYEYMKNILISENIYSEELAKYTADKLNL